MFQINVRSLLKMYSMCEVRLQRITLIANRNQKFMIFITYSENIRVTANLKTTIHIYLHVFIHLHTFHIMNSDIKYRKSLKKMKKKIAQRFDSNDIPKC